VTRNRFTVDNDRIGARVDRSSTEVRSHVKPTIGSIPTLLQDNWESNDPADRTEPDNASLNPTEFGYPPMNRHTYAHEFGHILGLHDTYVEGSWEPKPGAPVDLMSRSSMNFIDQSTIDRVVERNRDRLKDTKGNPVDLDDLTCELVFRAFLMGSENDYHASHLMNSGATPPCQGGAVTASQSQRMRVDSGATDIEVVDDATTPAGYRLTALFDQLVLQLNTIGLARDLAAAGYFDLPVTVEVVRANSNPASGNVPAVLDLATPGCADGGPGGNNLSDCGRREYQTWMAMRLGPGTTIWPDGSLLPRVLSGVGYSPLRLDSLYRNCSGPRPWPGAIKGEQGSAATFGTLPTRDALQKVWDDWARDGKAGQLDIDGDATRNVNQQGQLVEDAYLWTLTLCPVDKDGKIPPGCP